MTQNNVTAFRKGYKLREATEVSTGYRGRGLQPLQKVLEAGTEVLLTITKYTGAYISRDGEQHTSIKYTVTVNIDGVIYGASKSVPVGGQ